MLQARMAWGALHIGRSYSTLCDCGALDSRACTMRPPPPPPPPEALFTPRASVDECYFDPLSARGGWVPQTLDAQNAT